MGINLGSTAISDMKIGTTQVDRAYLGSTLLWGTAPTPTVIKALKFTSSSAQTLGVDTTKLGTISPSFQYSTDNGVTWTTWDVVNDTLSFGSGTDLYVRGSNTFLAKAGDNYIKFVFSTNSPVNCSGNIMHLFDYTQDLTAFPDDANNSSRGTKRLFEGCTALTAAPALPATTLAGSCYYDMFSGCASLVTAPALPATTLADHCYHNMFNACTSLSTLPLLPATTLANECYYGMFEGCTQIKISDTYSETGYPYVYTFGAIPGLDGERMFIYTGGTFTSRPTQQTYYTSNTIIS